MMLVYYTGHCSCISFLVTAACFIRACTPPHGVSTLRAVLLSQLWVSPLRRDTWQRLAGDIFCYHSWDGVALATHEESPEMPLSILQGTG